MVPEGTIATIWPSAQLVIDVAGTALKFTMPCVLPKPLPVIVTEVPGAPLDGCMSVITGLGREPPAEIATLSNVAVLNAVLTLLTAKPTYTFCAVTNVWGVPICDQ